MMMKPHMARSPLPPAIAHHRADSGPALLLACGNSLRQDDGVGLRIAEAAEHLFPASRLRVVAAQQFTPEMAADLAATELAIFVDASAADEPGSIRVVSLAARDESPETHRLDPPALLAMAQSVCGHAPARAFALTIGAGSFGYGEEISGPLRQAVPRALRLLTNLVTAFSGQA
jgi:hydrogenase maturation protease